MNLTKLTPNKNLIIKFQKNFNHLVHQRRQMLIKSFAALSIAESTLEQKLPTLITCLNTRPLLLLKILITSRLNIKRTLV